MLKHILTFFKYFVLAREYEIQLMGERLLKTSVFEYLVPNRVKVRKRAKSLERGEERRKGKSERDNCPLTEVSQLILL